MAESPVKIQSHKEFGVTNQAEQTALIDTSTLVHEEPILILNQEPVLCGCQSEFVLTKSKSSEVSIGAEISEKFIENKNTQINVFEPSYSLIQDDQPQVSKEKCDRASFDKRINEMSQKNPPESHTQYVATDNIVQNPGQSIKSECYRGATATRSLKYDSMEIAEKTAPKEPLSQLYKHDKNNKSAESCKSLNKIYKSPRVQSLRETMQLNQTTVSTAESINAESSTQSYEIDSIENLVENMETDMEIKQEDNLPSQSNDAHINGIGIASMSMEDSSTMDENETASSSYVPEALESQERDQDQESAISTSSYEIPPCEELHIASSSLFPETSIQSEHSSIHGKDISEISTSYNPRPDSSSPHIDTLPRVTSSYDDDIILQQNISTSYQVPILMSSLDKPVSRDYVTHSSSDRSESNSYYPHHHEITHSFYESICKQSSSRLPANSEEEATPSYYDSNIKSEASQSYLNQGKSAQAYGNADISQNYYNPPRIEPELETESKRDPESEASQSYYSTRDCTPGQSSLQGSSQSFYLNKSDEQVKQEDTSSTYITRYSLDYASVDSALDRHALVESSLQGRSMDR